MDAGLIHTCGITAESRAYCWGRNKYNNGALEYGSGQLGDGTTTDRHRPTAVATTLRFRQVSAGSYHTCGVTGEYRAYCWGRNQGGQLGDGTTSNRLKPVAVAGGHRFRQVSAGAVVTCGVSYPDYRAYCWGSNGGGQLGDGTTISRLTPVAVAGALRFRHLSVGWTHACGVTTENQAYCWGNNRDGALGDGSTVSQRLRPTRVAGGQRFRQIDAGGWHTCGVTTGDRAYCWGWNILTQLGYGGTASKRLSPTAVGGGLYFREVSTGSYYSCGLTTANRAYCWGDNGIGQLGDGTRTQRRMPAAVVGGHQFRQIVAGGFQSCGRDLARKAYCWGDNGAGQLGDGTTISRSRPQPVVGPM